MPWTSHFLSSPRNPTKTEFKLPRAKFHLPFTSVYFLSRGEKGQWVSQAREHQGALC